MRFYLAKCNSLRATIRPQPQKQGPNARFGQVSLVKHGHVYLALFSLNTKNVELPGMHLEKVCQWYRHLASLYLVLKQRCFNTVCLNICSLEHSALIFWQLANKKEISWQ